MAYTPINWQTGDTITAEKMNKMDNGWEATSTQLFSETVTTENSQQGYIAELSYTSTSAPDVLTIAFDNTNYQLNRQDGDGYSWYGGAEPGDFSTYPFFIYIEYPYWILATQIAGTYSIAASGNVIEVSETFKSAVDSVVRSSGGVFPMLCFDGVTTADEMNSAQMASRLMYFYDRDGACSIITNIGTSPITIVPSSNIITARFDSNDIFTITYN